MEREVPDYQISQNQKREKNRNHLKKESRRGFLFKSILGLGSLVGSYLYLRFEANWLETTRKKVVIHSLKNKAPIRLLHLSDLHFSNTVSLENIDFALHTAYSLLPDICVITGDFITDQKTDNELKDMSRILSKYARKIPTFASLGNHDGGEWAGSRGGPKSSQKIEQMLKFSGIKLLQNQINSIYVKGHPITIAGVGDLWSKTCLPHKCLTKNLKTESQRTVLLLCHNPDAKELLKDYRWDLMLCGHTHGGQLKIPFTNWTPFAPVQDRSMVEGLFSWKGRQIHITRGIGNLWGFRLNCRPEISMLELSSS